MVAWRTVSGEWCSLGGRHGAGRGGVIISSLEGDGAGKSGLGARSAEEGRVRRQSAAHGAMAHIRRRDHADHRPQRGRRSIQIDLGGIFARAFRHHHETPWRRGRGRSEEQRAGEAPRGLVSC